MTEFSRAVREIAGLDASQIPETEMEELFRVVDADESGAIDAAELRNEAAIRPWRRSSGISTSLRFEDDFVGICDRIVHIFVNCVRGGPGSGQGGHHFQRPGSHSAGNPSGRDGSTEFLLA